MSARISPRPTWWSARDPCRPSPSAALVALHRTLVSVTRRCVSGAASAFWLGCRWHRHNGFGCSGSVPRPCGARGSSAIAEARVCAGLAGRVLLQAGRCRGTFPLQAHAGFSVRAHLWRDPPYGSVTHAREEWQAYESSLRFRLYSKKLGELKASIQESLIAFAGIAGALDGAKPAESAGRSATGTQAELCGCSAPGPLIFLRLRHQARSSPCVFVTLGLLSCVLLCRGGCVCATLPESSLSWCSRRQGIRQLDPAGRCAFACVRGCPLLWRSLAESFTIPRRHSLRTRRA